MSKPQSYKLIFRVKKRFNKPGEHGLSLQSNELLASKSEVVAVELDTDDLVVEWSRSRSWSSCSSSEELDRLPEAERLAEFDLTAEVIVEVIGKAL